MTGVPNGAFGDTAFANWCLRGADPGWECSLSRNGSCCAGTGMRWTGCRCSRGCRRCTAVIPRCMCGWAGRWSVEIHHPAQPRRRGAQDR